MLALFPELLFLTPFAALMIRFALAVVLIMTGYAHISREGGLTRAWGIVEIAAALALIAGAWTQAIALAVAVWFVAGLFVRDMRFFPKSTVLLAIVMALSIVLTGAGAVALDWPL